jgi:hypothetical protein
MILSDGTVDQALKGLSLTFQVHVLDNIGIAEVIVRFRDEMGVMQYVPMVGSVGHYQITHSVSRLAVGDVSYSFYVEDTARNSNTTDERTISLINAPPEIGEVPTFEVIEGETETLDLSAYITDLNDAIDNLTIMLDPKNVTIVGTILEAMYDEWVPDHNIEVSVSDRDSTVWMNITIHVINTNDPPVISRADHSANGSKVNEGENVTFFIEFWDPDLVLGGTVDVMISSNISGVLAAFSTADPIEHTINMTEPGAHIITITVDDGELVDTRTLELTVVELSPPIDDPDPPSDDGSQIIGTMAVIIIIVVVAGSMGTVWAFIRSRR